MIVFLTAFRENLVIIVFFYFFYFISLIADGPHHYHPACGHKGSSHLSPVHALQIFYCDASSALLQLVNQWLNFTYSRSHAFRYERKNTNPTFGKNRTHDFRTSRCAAYLLDHSGDELVEHIKHARGYVHSTRCSVIEDAHEHTQ